MRGAKESFLEKLAVGLATRSNAELLRSLELPTGIDFTSNDYLGFASSPILRTSMAQAIESCGTGSGGSRLLRGNQEIHVNTERALALFSGRERALLFSSGFAANLGIFAALAGPHDVIFSDALNHASIIDGMRLSKAQRLIFSHQDFSQLANVLESTPCSGQRFIVTESVFSMDGDITNLRTLVEIAHRHNALIIVDESHATGLYGKRGSGVVERDGLSSHVLCTMHTGGKALGVGGAWVAGDETLVDHLVNHARSFIYSTAPIPALAAGLKSALRHLANNQNLVADLHARAAFLRNKLRKLGIDTLNSASHIVPVLIGENHEALRVSANMRKAGYDVRAIRPPTVQEGTARLRLTVSATMDETLLDDFANQLHTVMGLE